MRLICILFSAVLLAGLTSTSLAAVPQSDKIYLFPDEYSVLDKYPIIKEYFDKIIKI